MQGAALAVSPQAACAHVPSGSCKTAELPTAWADRYPAPWQRTHSGCALRRVAPPVLSNFPVTCVPHAQRPVHVPDNARATVWRERDGRRHRHRLVQTRRRCKVAQHAAGDGAVNSQHARRRPRLQGARRPTTRQRGRPPNQVSGCTGGPACPCRPSTCRRTRRSPPTRDTRLRKTQPWTECQALSRQSPWVARKRSSAP
jgi:hypothetical protein